MFRLLMCIVIGATSMSAEATTPCASGFLSTPCPTLTTTPCVPVIVASTVSTTPLPCPSTGTTTPCGQWAVTATPLPCPSTGTTTPCVARTATTTPLPCPSTGTTTPCVASTVTTTPLPCPSTVTMTPCIVASTATATPPVPCSSTSTMPCPVVASTLTTTPCGPVELAQLGALAVAGSHERPQRDHSASSLPHSKLTLRRGGRETTKVSTTETEKTTTTTVEKTSTTSSAITTSTTTTHTSSTLLTTIASLTGMVARDSNMANSIGGLAVSGASMPAKTVLSRRHSVHLAQKKIRSKEHEGTHTSGADKSLMLILVVASLSLLLFVVVPYSYNCHRSSDKAPLDSARGNEEAPLLADDVVEPPMWTKIAPESPRELASPVSPRHQVEELPDTPEVLADTVPLVSDPMQSQAEDATDVTAEPEPERPIAVEASEDKPSSLIAPKEVSPSPNRRREIPPVGEAPKNSGCCACRGRH